MGCKSRFVRDSADRIQWRRIPTDGIDNDWTPRNMGADMSRRLRPQADTAGIGTRKPCFDPGRGRSALAPLSGCKRDYSDFTTGGIGLTASTTG